MSRPAAHSFVVAFLALTALISTASSASALTVNTLDVAQTLDTVGRVVEVDQSPALEAAIDRANRAGVVVAVLNQNSEGDGASDLAETLNLDLDSIGSTYHSVLVITNNGYGAHSWSATNTELSLALDDAFEGISTGDLARGLDAFVDTLPTAGVFLPSPTQEETATSLEAEAPDQNSTGGIGFGWILAGLGVLGGAFLFLRRLVTGRKKREDAEKQLELDRSEIVEQLRSNADRVISLGDRVIISENAELIALYEEASSTYQAVSGEVDNASTAEAIDALDDRIDTAEWQLAVIEAELDGKPRPARPSENTEPAQQQAPNVEPDPRATRRETTWPSPSNRPIDRGTRRQGSSGGMGGALGSILGNIVLGGGGLGSSRSRRTQRRTQSRTRSGSGFPSSGGFGFPSGGSRSTASRSSSRRRGSSGGRTIRRTNRRSSSRRSSKGGRSF